MIGTVHKLYALTLVEPDGKTNICYLLSESAVEVWKAVIESEMLGTGHTMKSLKAQGWKAMPVTVLA